MDDRKSSLSFWNWVSNAPKIGHCIRFSFSEVATHPRLVTIRQA